MRQIGRSLALLFVLLTSCGRTALYHPGSDTPAADASTPADARIPPDDATAPIACPLPPQRSCPAARPPAVWDFNDIAGEPTVVTEVEVLGNGQVLVAGYAGLFRTDTRGSAWHRVDGAPELLSSPSLQLRRRGAAGVLAITSGTLVFSVDGGQFWRRWRLPESTFGQIHIVDPGQRVVIGGDAAIVVVDLDSGPAAPIEIAALDGDDGNYFENNLVYGLVRTAGGVFIAAERFGRLARAPALRGPWTALPANIGGESELLWVEGLGTVARAASGQILVSCDDGQSWHRLGDTDRFAEAGASATQLAVGPNSVLVAPGYDRIELSCDLGQRWSDLPPAPGSERPAAYDVSIAAEGWAWVAGHHQVFLFRP